MIKLRTIVPILCLVTALSGLAAYAADAPSAEDTAPPSDCGGDHHWHHRHGGGLGEMGLVLHKLNLGADQKTQIKAIFAGEKGQLDALHESARANRQALATTPPTSCDGRPVRCCSPPSPTRHRTAQRSGDAIRVAADRTQAWRRRIRERHASTGAPFAFSTGYERSAWKPIGLIGARPHHTERRDRTRAESRRQRAPNGTNVCVRPAGNSPMVAAFAASLLC